MHLLRCSNLSMLRAVLHGNAGSRVWGARRLPEETLRRVAEAAKSRVGQAIGRPQNAAEESNGSCEATQGSIPSKAIPSEDCIIVSLRWANRCSCRDGIISLARLARALVVKETVCRLRLYVEEQDRLDECD